jgi:hypothetical protein
VKITLLEVEVFEVCFRLADRRLSATGQISELLASAELLEKLSFARSMQSYKQASGGEEVSSKHLV